MIRPRISRETRRDISWSYDQYIPGAPLQEWINIPVTPGGTLKKSLVWTLQGCQEALGKRKQAANFSHSTSQDPRPPFEMELGTDKTGENEDQQVQVEPPQLCHCHALHLESTRQLHSYINNIIYISH